VPFEPALAFHERCHYRCGTVVLAHHQSAQKGEVSRLPGVAFEYEVGQLPLIPPERDACLCLEPGYGGTPEDRKVKQLELRLLRHVDAKHAINLTSEGNDQVFRNGMHPHLAELILVAAQKSLTI
jgi:hypothetical protein